MCTRLSIMIIHWWVVWLIIFLDKIFGFESKYTDYSLHRDPKCHAGCTI